MLFISLCCPSALVFNIQVSPIILQYCYDRYLIVPRKSFSLSTRGVDASFTPGYTFFLVIYSRPSPSRILSSSTADLLLFASLPASRAHGRLPFPPVRHHCRPLRIPPVSDPRASSQPCSGALRPGCALPMVVSHIPDGGAPQSRSAMRAALPLHSLALSCRPSNTARRL